MVWTQLMMMMMEDMKMMEAEEGGRTLSLLQEMSPKERAFIMFMSLRLCNIVLMNIFAGQKFRPAQLLLLKIQKH